MLDKFKTYLDSLSGLLLSGLLLSGLRFHNKAIALAVCLLGSAQLVAQVSCQVGIMHHAIIVITDFETVDPTSRLFCEIEFHSYKKIVS